MPDKVTVRVVQYFRDTVTAQGVHRNPGETLRVRADDAELLAARGQVVVIGGLQQQPRSVQFPASGPSFLKDPAVFVQSPCEPSVPVWVVIPTRNRPSDAARQARDALKQLDGPDDRVVVVDDGSDPPVRLAADPRVICLRIPKLHHGPNAARAAGTALVPDSAAVLELDDHDRLTDGAVARMRALIDGGAELVYGAITMLPPTRELARQLDKADYRPGLFRQGSQTAGPRMYTKALYRQAGGYALGEFPAGDYALMVRMEDVGAVACRAEGVLAVCPIEPDGISIRHLNDQNENARRHRSDSIWPCARPRRVPRSAPLSADASVRLGGLRAVVVIPVCLAAARFLADCVDSVAGTLGERDGVVIVADGPMPDGARESALAALGDRGAWLQLPERSGFAVACNAGAAAADSEYVALLNVDTRVTPGWLDALIDTADAQGAAVVGPLILKWDGSAIDSFGSTFRWEHQKYLHTFQGASMKGDDARAWDDAPKTIDRDMVTAGCCLLPRADWNAVGGFDEVFRIGYCEDADLCMRVRARGGRIVATSASRILHFGGSANSQRHEHYDRNQAVMRERWIDTGLVDRCAKARGERPHGADVVACMIALNEEDFIEAAVESVMPLADRLVIVEGGTRYAAAAGLTNGGGCSIDGTHKAIERIVAAYGDRVTVKCPPGNEPWRDKSAMRQAYADELADGEWMLLLDADEVFTEDGLWRLSALMHDHEIVMPGYWLFWGDLGTVGTGAWDQFPQVKAVRWRAGYTYGNEANGNTPSDADGHPLHQRGLVTPERLYCHYSWVGPEERLRRKAAYYQQQCARDWRQGYIDNVVLRYRSDPKSVLANGGTHPRRLVHTHEHPNRVSGAAPFTGTHPEPVRRRLSQGAFAWA